MKPYTMIKKGDAEIAVFGIMGKEAAAFAPESGVYFEDPVEASRRVVSQIQRDETPDLIVCLSHSGTTDNLKESEDVKLGENVPEIDVIVSAHSHTQLPEPVTAGNAVLVSAGEYTHNLGHLTMEKNNDSWVLTEYALKPIGPGVKKSRKISKDLKRFREKADRKYFAPYGYTSEQKLAENNIPFTDIGDFSKVQGEDSLGNLIADGYSYGASAERKPVDVAVVPAGVVRASFQKRTITVGDVFNAVSLGIGPDGKAGYPLVIVYLTGKELKAAAEIDASVSDLMPVARLYTSGLTYSYNANRLFLNRAVDVELQLHSGEQLKLDDHQLYSVAGDLYTCQMLGSIEEKTLGLLKIQPKDKDGNLITDFTEHIVYHNNREVKAWYALASYMESFHNGQVPESYGHKTGRKTEIDSKSIYQLTRQPNHVAWIALTVLLVFAGVITIVVVLTRKKIRKRQKQQIRN